MLSSRTLLIIDDDPSDQETYCRYLRHPVLEGCNVLRAETGAAGLDLCVQEQPSVVLLDTLLPDMSTLEWLGQLQRCNSALPAVILLLKEDEAIAPQLMEAGALDYVAKGDLEGDDLRLAVLRAIETLKLRTQLQQAKREQQQAEVALEHQMQAFFNGALDAMLIADDDGRYVDVNPAACNLFGMTRAELLERTIADFVPPGFDFAQSWQHFRTVGKLSGEFQIHRLDGQVRDVEFSATANFLPHRHLSVLRDISHRRDMEAALHASEERFRLATRAMTGVIFDWNLQTNTVYRSEGLHELVGVHPNQLSSNREWWIDQMHPEDLAQLQQMIPTVLASGCDRYEGEYRVRHADGRWIDVWERGQLIRDEQGCLVRIVGFTTDITDRKRAAEALRQSEAQLRQQAEELAQSNQLKDEFLTILSHELRTPLNPILGWAKLLQTRQFSPEKMREGLATIERNAKLQTQLVDDLLDISGMIRGNLSLSRMPVTLDIPISTAVKILRPSAEAKQITLTASLEPDVGCIMGDSTRLQQIVQNLLSNAIKFTPEGGRVEVRLKRLEGEGGRIKAEASKDNNGRVKDELEVRVSPTLDSRLPTPHSPSTVTSPSLTLLTSKRQPTSFAEISVIDTGCGINPHFLPHVFELFRQQDGSTTRQFNGLGLGLAIARQLVEAHGGTITAASLGQDQGATFTVRLPLMAPTATIPPR